MSDKLDLKRIIQVDFQDGQYYREMFPKKQIVLHHSAGWDSARLLFEVWAKDTKRIATCMGVQDNGELYQGFSSKYWGYHLGVTSDALRSHGVLIKNQHVELERGSIGIEICNWGPLAEWRGDLYTYTGRKVERSRAIKYDEGYRTLPYTPFFSKIGVQGKTAFYYERYTEAEINSLRQLLTYWGEVWNIPLDYRPEMWKTSRAALMGEAGLWTHVSFRSDKSDCHPQPDFIEMLQGLKK